MIELELFSTNYTSFLVFVLPIFSVFSLHWNLPSQQFQTVLQKSLWCVGTLFTYHHPVQFIFVIPWHFGSRLCFVLERTAKLKAHENTRNKNHVWQEKWYGKTKVRAELFCGALIPISGYISQRWNWIFNFQKLENWKQMSLVSVSASTPHTFAMWDFIPLQNFNGFSATPWHS